MCMRDLFFLFLTFLHVNSILNLNHCSADPDITWGDGIYSAYFTQLGSNPGFYSVSIHIDDNKGQAVVPVHTNISRGFYGKNELLSLIALIIFST